MLQAIAQNSFTVGELVARFLEHCGVRAAFGVISIHNMPILDALHTRGKIRLVTARGEAGATNMADASARVSGTLGVCVTSTGTPTSWACCLPWARLPCAYAMLLEHTPPCSPVSVEIATDIQSAFLDEEQAASYIKYAQAAPNFVAYIQLRLKQVLQLAGRLRTAQRPLLWLGGGARGTARAVQRLVTMGFGVVTSVQGRGVLAENHPANLGAFNCATRQRRVVCTVRRHAGRR